MRRVARCMCIYERHNGLLQRCSISWLCCSPFTPGTRYGAVLRSLCPGRGNGESGSHGGWEGEDHLLYVDVRPATSTDMSMLAAQTASASPLSAAGGRHLAGLGLCSFSRVKIQDATQVTELDGRLSSSSLS
jgi:hypothetical protein